MKSAKAAQLSQVVTTLAAILCVTLLCALGKVDATSALLIIMGAAGITGANVTAVHATDVASNAPAPAPPPPPPPDYAPNNTPVSRP